MKTKISETSVANKTGSSVKDYLKQEVGVGDVYFASLEPRIALDAAAGADLVDEALDATDVELEAVELTAPVAQSASAADLVQMLEADAEAGSASDLSRQIVFVDASIDNFDEFIAGLPSDVETYVISPDHDGISQIASTLAGRSGIEAIHIVSHGDAGALILGDSLVTAESIQGRYADDLAAIGASLTDSADLLIYGCDFAFGAEGEEAADLLASATGADVAASTDITGSEIFGGDWVLEYETGEIEADALQIDEWEGQLNNTVIDVPIDGSYNFSADDFDAGRDGTISTITIAALPRDGELTLNGDAVVEGQEIAAADLASLLYTPPAGADVNVDYRLYYTADDDIGPNPSPPIGIHLDTYAHYVVPNADYFVETSHSPADLAIRTLTVGAVPSGPPVIFTDTGQEMTVGTSFTQAQVDAGEVVIRYARGEVGETIDGLVIEAQRNVDRAHFTSTSTQKFRDDTVLYAGQDHLTVADGSRLLTDGIYAKAVQAFTHRVLEVPDDAAYFETIVTGFQGENQGIQVVIYGLADGTSTILHNKFVSAANMAELKLDVSGYDKLKLSYRSNARTGTFHFGLEAPRFTSASSQIVTSAQEAAAIDSRGLQAPPAGATWNSFELGFAPTNGVLQLGGIDLVAGTSYQMSDLDDVLFIPDAGAAIGRDAELFSLELTASDTTTAREVVSIDIVSAQAVAPSSADISAAIEAGTGHSFAVADFALAASAGNSVDEVIIDVLPSTGTLTLNGVAVATGQVIAVSDIENFAFVADVDAYGIPYNSFDFRVRDSAGTLSDTYTVALDVYSRPVVTVPSITLPAGVTHAFAVRDFGFSDADGGEMASIIIDAVPSLGGLRLNGVLVTAGQEITVEDLGDLTFDAPPAGTTDAYDSFSFRLGDEDGRYSDVALVDIDIGVPPTTADNTISTAEDIDYAFSTGDFTFSDGNVGDSLAAIFIDRLPGLGILSLNGVAVSVSEEIAVADIANLIYSPPTDLAGTGFASFAFSVKDDTGLFSLASSTMTIDVTSVEDAPEGADNTISIAEDTDHIFTVGDFSFSDRDDANVQLSDMVIGVSVDGSYSFRADDFDAGRGGTTSSVTIATLPEDGGLTLNGVAVVEGQEVVAADLGSLLYTPPAGGDVNADHSFYYTIVDDIGPNPSPAMRALLDSYADYTTDADYFADMSQLSTTMTLRSLTVLAVPDGGPVVYNHNGDPIPVGGTFTQAQVDAGQVVIRYNSGVIGGPIDGLILETTLDIDVAHLTVAGNAAIHDNAFLGTNSLRSYDASHVIDDGIYLLVKPTWSTYQIELPADATHFETVSTLVDPAYSRIPDLNVQYYGVNADGTSTLLYDQIMSDEPVADLGLDVSGYDKLEIRTISTDGIANPTNANRYVFVLEKPVFTSVLEQIVTGGQEAGIDSFAAVIIDSLPSSGTLALNGVAVAAGQEIAVADIPNLVYSPAADAVGTGLATFSFSVKDDSGLVSVAPNTVSIDATSVEDAPEGADVTVSTDEDTDFVFTESDFGFSDVDADSTLAAVIIDSLPASGAFALNGVAVAAGQEIAVADIPNLVYSPSANAFGTGLASFTFSVKDNTGLVSVASTTMTIDVVSVEDAPEGADNTFSTVEDTDFSFAQSDFGFSDVDQGSTFAAVIIDSLPASGTLAVNGAAVAVDQEITLADLANLVYSPAAHEFGTALGSFTFSVKDSAGLVSEASNSITIDVTSVEDAPEAADVTISSAEDTDRTFNIADFGFSDVDADSTFAAVIIDSLPASGTITLDGATVTTGQEIAVADIANLVYSPPADATGTGLASFTFSVKDNTGLVSVASNTVSIDVTSVEDAPEGADVTVSTDEDVDFVFTESDFGFSDVDADSTFAAVIIDSLPASGVLSLNGVAVAAGEEIAASDIPNLVYSPPADAIGTGLGSFTFSVKDSTGLVSLASSTVTIDVTSVEDAPDAADNTLVGTEDTGFSFAAADFGYSDVDLDSTFAAVVIDSLPASGTLALNGVAVVAGQEIATADIANLIYSPATDAYGSAAVSFTFSTKDNTGLVSEDYSMSFDIAGTPDAPQGADATVSTLEDTDLSFSQVDFGFSDADADSTFAAVIIDSLPTSGTLALNGVAVTASQEIAVADIANLVYSPPADEFGTGLGSFSFSVKDSTGLVSDASNTMTIDVTSIEDAPESADGTVSTAEDTVHDHIFSASDFGFSDVDLDSTFAAVIIDSLPTSGAFTLNDVLVTAGQEIVVADIADLVYSPPANEFGTAFATFSFSVKDSTGLVSDASSTMTVDVTSVEDAPDAADNRISTAEDTDHTFGIADFGFSDADLDSTFAAVVIDALPASGVLSLNGVAVTGGQEIAVADIANLVYSPPANEFGTAFATFSFSVKDSAGLTSEASNTITIDVTSVEDAPESVDNTVSTVEDTDLSFSQVDFGFSDVDLDSTFAAVIIDGLPASGTLALNGVVVAASQEIAIADIADLVYSPPANEFGTGLGSFTFSVKDSTGLTSEASNSMTIDITSVEDAPDAADNTVSTLENTDFSFSQSDFGFSDVDLDSTFAAVIIDSPSTVGALTLNGVAVTASQEIAVADIANLVYSPPTNEFGADVASFTFSVKDSTGLVSEASRTIAIDVNSVENAPEGADSTVSTAEDTDRAFNIADFGFSDVDLDSTFAAVIVDSLPTSGALALNGVAVTASQEIAVADIASLVYSPPADAIGTGLASFTFSVKDNTGRASEASSIITIDVTSVEDAPEGADTTVSTAEDTDRTFSVADFGFSDVDLDSTFVAVIIDSLPASGTLVVNGVAVTAGQEIAAADIANLVYSPPANAFGTGLASFTFSVKDSTGLVSDASSTITIDVTSVEDAPEAADNTVSTAEDVDHTFSVADFGFSDVDLDSTFAAVIIDSLPAAGALTLNGAAVTAGQEIAASDIANLAYSPPANEFGTAFATFSFSVKDSTGLVSEASSTITIDVTSVEDAPEGADNTVSTAEDTDFSFSQGDFGFSDVDADSTFAAVVIDALPTSGTLVLNGVAVSASQEIAVADIANLVYSPPADAFGTGLGSFTFSVKDSAGLVSDASSTMTIDVTSIEDAPESADSTVLTQEDIDFSFSQGDFGFSDIDLDSTFAAVIIDSLPAAGALTLNGVDVTTGQEIAVADIVNLVYSPAAIEDGLASFTFSVKDSTGLVSEASSTMTIDVASLDHAPDAADNTISIAEDIDHTFSVADFGFSDVDQGSSFAAVIIDGLPASGTLTLNGVAVTASQEIAVADIASLVYSPTGNAFGTDFASFGFSVKDSTGLVSDASNTITIDVTSVEDAPEGADNTISTAEDVDRAFSVADFGFSDVDLDSSFAALVIDSLPTSGTLSLNGAAVTGGQEIAASDIANLVYSPPADAFGTDFASFTFSVKDSTGLASDASSTMTIDVTSVADAPEGADNVVATPQDTGYRFALADFQYSDIDGNEFASVIIDRLPTSGTLSLNGIAVTTGQEIAHTDIEALSFVSEDSSGSMPLSFNYRLRDDGGTSNGGIDTSEPYIMNIAVEPVYELSATFAANGVLEIDLTADLAAELDLDAGDSMTRNADPATAHIEFEYLDGSGQRVLFEAGDSITASQAQSLAISSSDIRMTGEFTVDFVIDRADGSRGHVSLLLDVTAATSGSSEQGGDSQSETQQLSRAIEHADKIASKVSSISETRSLSLPAVARGFAASGQSQGQGLSQSLGQNHDFGGASLSTDAESFATGSVAGLQVIDRAESNVHNMRATLAVGEDKLLVAIDDLSAQFGEGGLADGLVVEMLDGSAIPDWITITATGEIEIDTSESGDVGLVELRVIRQGDDGKGDDGKGDDGKGDDANQKGVAVGVNLAENSVQIAS